MSEIQLIDILNTPETKHMMNSYGISHVRVFGSYGQNTQTEESDIDLMYEYDDSTPWKDR